MDTSSSQYGNTRAVAMPLPQCAEPVEPRHSKVDCTNPIDVWLDTLVLQVEGAEQVDIVRSTEWAPSGYSLAFIVLSGSGFATVSNERPREIIAGDLLLRSESSKLRLSAQPGQRLHCTMVQFRARIFGDIDFVQHVGLPVLIHPVSASQDLRELALEVALETAEKRNGWKRVVFCKMTELLVFALRNCKGNTATIKRRSPTKRTRRVAQIVFFIDTQLGRSSLSVEEIARAMYLSTAQLRRIFLAELGVTPVQYIRSHRIERASRLLQTTDMCLKEIAFRCGFQDMSYFLRTFRKITAKTPSQFREEQWARSIGASCALPQILTGPEVFRGELAS